VAYRADIEIAVRGAQELKRLQNAILSASDAVNSLNSNLSGVANLVPRSFDNLNRTVAQAARSFNAAALGTKEATDAAREYVRATDAANAGLRERVALLAKVQAGQRRTVPGDAGVGQQTPALPPQLIRTYEIGKNWVKFFQDAAGVAVDLQARALNTKASWNDFFATAAQAAVNVKANSLNTQKNWNDFFATAAQAAVNVKANSLNTQQNWKDFFATAAQAAVNVKANSLNTQKNWNDFFATAAQAAVNVKANSLNTKASWNKFFIEAAQLADDLTARTRQIEGSASAAARNRLAADQEARRTAAPEVPRRLISGVAAPQGMAPGNASVSTAMQGPLAGPGAMGFPVALSLSKVEQAGLETAAKKQQILQRMVATRQALVGLAANLQRLDQNSAVAIADAVRSQDQLNAAKARQLALTQQIRASEGAASSAARQRLAQETARKDRIQNAGFGVQGPAAAPVKTKAKTGAGGSRLGGALSGSIIGGSFPLLFGQGAGAAAGGAAGGLVGGLLGPGGSFAGSLLGTLLGDIASKGKGIQDLADDMGLAAEQTKQLAAAFQEAGRDADKFGAAVQTVRGIGFADDEQVEVIKLVSKLTDDYGGKIDKIAAAYGNFVAKGKVGIADINKFTAQGIPILDELEKKYGKNRDQILALAKAGEITAQDLSDALVEIANRSDEVTKRTTSSWERTWENLKKGAGTSASAIAIILGNLVGVSTNVTGSILEVFSSLYLNLVNGAVNAAADISDSLASIANNIAAFYKANPLVIPSLRDAAVSGLESFKAGAKGTSKQLRELTKQPAGVGPITGPRIPGQLPATGSGGGKSAADKAADDAAREAARVAEIVRARQLATLELQRQAVFSQKIAEAEMAKDPILARQLQGQQDIMQLGIKIASELEKEKNTTAQLAMAREFQAKKALALLGIEIDIAKIKQQQTEQYNTIISDLDTELALKYAITEQERTQLRIAAEMRKLELSDPSLTESQRVQIQQAKERLAAPKTGRELVLERTGALEDELKSLTDVGNVAITVADGIGSAFATSFKGIISGSMTAKEALANFFTSVADMFLDMAAQIITKMITMTILNAVLGVLPGGGGGGGFGAAGAGFGGSNAFGSFDAGGGLAFGGGLNLMARANGGPVSSGQTYMVGERGPELFVPGRSGTIVANDKMGGGNTNVVVNVDAKGSSVEGDEQGANQLGRVISAAVQSELIKQQRPGGILAR